MRTRTAPRAWRILDSFDYTGDAWSTGSWAVAPSRCTNSGGWREGHYNVGRDDSILDGDHTPSQWRADARRDIVCGGERRLISRLYLASPLSTAAHIAGCCGGRNEGAGREGSKPFGGKPAALW